MESLREEDLYLPLKEFLESQGYQVKGEVCGCDVVAVRGDETPVVVELKLTLNLDLILQAVHRLALTPKVYLGIPKGCSTFKRKRRRVLKLVRMLGLGLVVIDPSVASHGIDVLLDPSEYKPRARPRDRERLLGEFQRRVGDPNLGGSASRKGVMTAYRQRALRIARYLEANGPAKPSDVARELGEPESRAILYRDVYGWFDRVAHATYDLSPRGKEEIPLWSEPT